MSIHNLHMTDLTTFQDCRQKFYYSKIARITPTARVDELDPSQSMLSPDTDPDFPLTFGKIGHKVLEEYYAKQIPLLEGFNRYGNVLRGDYYEIGRCIFSEYQQEYADDLEKFEILMVEVPVTVTYEVDGFEQEIELNMDLLVRSRENNAVFAMDHKFYAKMPSTTEMQMRDQFTGYVTAVRSNGHPIAGIIVNIMRKGMVYSPKYLKNGELSVDKSQSTTYFRYLKAVELQKLEGRDISKYDDILEFLRTNPHPLLRRELILKTQAETDVWKRNLVPRLRDIKRAIDEGEESFYPSPGFHCSFCEFQKLCISELQGGTGAGYMETMYRRKEDHER